MSDRIKVGPFLCEWCNSPMSTAKGKRMDTKTTASILGCCEKCNAVTWSKPVYVSAAMKEQK